MAMMFCFQFNNFLLVCHTVWIGIKQNYKIKANMPLDGMQVSEQYLMCKRGILRHVTQTKSCVFFMLLCLVSSIMYRPLNSCV